MWKIHPLFPFYLGTLFIYLFLKFLSIDGSFLFFFLQYLKNLLLFILSLSPSLSLFKCCWVTYIYLSLTRPLYPPNHFKPKARVLLLRSPLAWSRVSRNGMNLIWLFRTRGVSWAERLSSSSWMRGPRYTRGGGKRCWKKKREKRGGTGKSKTERERLSMKRDSTT